jgi:chemotaxis methyl-accepting protein methylase
MTLEEHARVDADFTYSILASDISTRVLKHAQLAIYGRDQI